MNQNQDNNILRKEFCKLFLEQEWSVVLWAQLEVDFFYFELSSSVSDDEVTATQCETQILRDDLWNINNTL